jgi:sugar phosphate isomerase/epimerase
VRLESLNPPALDYNLGSVDDEVRATSVRLYERALELAADLDVKGVVVVPGRVSGLFPPPSEQTMSRLEDSIGTLASLAGKFGLRLHLETHPLTSLPSASQLKGFIERLGLKSLGVAYDFANAEFIGEDQAVAIGNLGPLLTQLHVSDGRRGTWRHDGLGTGTVDFKAAFAAAEEIRFTGVVVLELSPASPKKLSFRVSLISTHCDHPWGSRKVTVR